MDVQEITSPALSIINVQNCYYHVYDSEIAAFMI